MKRIVSVFLMCVLFLTGCSGGIAEVFHRGGSSEETSAADGNRSATALVINTEPEKEEYELTLSAVGDNLLHTPILDRARQSDGSYDFTPMYEHMKDTISSYDISVINQETIYVEDNNNVSSYPCFGSPTAVGDALIDAGFDVVLSATNHTWDKGRTGVMDSINYWKEHPEVTLLGINETEEEYDTVDIVSKNNIDLAMFNYTYGLNGFALPADEPYLVNLLDNKEKFIQDVKDVEDQVDFTICFLHIGTEYVYTPTEYQVGYINDLIDAGADIVICAHPHVVEPYKMVTTENGNEGLVYYSCGNFISGQSEPERMLGGMASLTLKKTVQGDKSSCEIADYDFIPVVTHWNSSVHTVYLLSDYTEELAAQNALRGKGLSVEYLQNLWEDIMDEK